MLDIVTMKFGEKYSSDWANRLFAGVKRHCSVPFRFVCFTEKPKDLHSDIHIEQREDLSGWWNHLYAFSGWTGYRQMMIDIDDVITGPLDDLATYDGPHAVNSDVYNSKNVDGGFQLISPGNGLKLWKQFIVNPSAVRSHYYSDKQFYIAHINDSLRVDNLFPGQWVSYKVHCQNKGLPENARIVGFHGKPKPDEVNEEWIKEHWQL